MRCVAALAELLEHQRLLRQRHAGAVVLHLHAQAAGLHPQPDVDTAAFSRHKLGGIGQQVQHHLQQPVGVSAQQRHGIRFVQQHQRAAFAEEFGSGLQSALQELAELDLVVQPLGVAGLDLGHVQHLVDEPAQAFGLGHHQAQELLALRAVHLRVVAHQLGQCADAGQRGAQLVGDAAHEVVLQRVQALELLVERTQFRRFFHDAQHIGHFQRLFFDHRGHHHARRRAADGAGKQRLGTLHELGIGIGGGGRCGQLRLRFLKPQEASNQRHQVGHLGAAAPEHTLRPGVLEHVDEEQGLAGFGSARRPRQRHAHEQARVGQQAPEEGVAEVVQPGQAQQRFGPQQRQAKGAMLQKAGA